MSPMHKEHSSTKIIKSELSNLKSIYIPTIYSLPIEKFINKDLKVNKKSILAEIDSKGFDPRFWVHDSYCYYGCQILESGLPYSGMPRHFENKELAQNCIKALNLAIQYDPGNLMESKELAEQLIHKLKKIK